MGTPEHTHTHGHDRFSDEASGWDDKPGHAERAEAVAALLKVTGDWQKHTGEAGAEGTLKSKSEKEAFVAPEKGSVILPEEPKQEEAPAEEAAEAPAEDAEKSE